MGSDELVQPLIGPGVGAPQPSRCRWSRCSLLHILASVALLLFIATSVQQLMSGQQAKRKHKWAPDLNVCEAYVGTDVDQPFSVILTADPGDFSGTPEAHFIIANLKHKHAKPRSQTVCAGHFSGVLMGQPVLVVTTGIGPPAAGLCTLEVVSACGPWIKEIVYFGTSGWSPARGGILNPPSCSAANPHAEPTRLGDVCVSPFSVNWTCKKATWAMQAAGYPNQCVKPEEVSSPNATYLYGECQFYADNMEGNLDLADDLIDAAKAVQARGGVPARTDAVNAVEARYWGAMRNATKAAYPPMEPDAAPRLWDYSQCMEVDGQFFYSGVPWELKARDYAADTLRAAGVAGDSVTARDVIAVSAMEGIGVAEALLRYHGLATTPRKIPYTHVRTLSNWLHQPVAQVKPGVWEVAVEIPEDFVTGYGYAIATGSATIMSLYQTRCEADRAHHRLPPATDCTFEIDYGGEVQVYGSNPAGNSATNASGEAGAVGSAASGAAGTAGFSGAADAASAAASASDGAGRPVLSRRAALQKKGVQAA
uniref:Nucleoside phosphorylase domain-containing protein n=1 Tax=Chlamydomonas leiostraca TaxID=1034604 RepID=A0A7S0RA27_9CHLO